MKEAIYFVCTISASINIKLSRPTHLKTTGLGSGFELEFEV